MKIFLGLFVLLNLHAAWANSQKMGLGIMIGNPTGLNGKYWLENDHAIDAGFGLSFGKHNEGSLHSDYLLHNKGALILNENNPMDIYYGIGGRMEFADSIELGIRLPIGVAIEIESRAADVFVEAAPILDFVGKSGLELHLLFGSRYYF